MPAAPTPPPAISSSLRALVSRQELYVMKILTMYVPAARCILKLSVG
jgi:hypothetical protein